MLKFEDVSYYRNDRGHYFVTVVLTEGKNRHIRRALSALWYRIKKLHRKIVGKHKIDRIKPGKWAEKKVK
jgi:16S rRNA U516 pseudouridylate synthase RsuA-like enzyme